MGVMLDRLGIKGDGDMGKGESEHKKENKRNSRIETSESDDRE